MSIATDEQIQEAVNSNGLKGVTITAEGEVSVTDRLPSSIENEVEKRVAEKVGEVQLSRAQRRLTRMKEEAKYEPTRVIQVPGDNEPWVIKKGSFPELIMTAKLAGRDEKGVLSLESTNQFAGFIAALLRTFVVVSETDKSPYFESLEDAWTFVEDGLTEAADAVSTLFYGIIDFNPAVYPEGAEFAKKTWAALTAAQASSTPQLDTQSTN